MIEKSIYHINRIQSIYFGDDFMEKGMRSGWRKSRIMSMTKRRSK